MRASIAFETRPSSLSTSPSSPTGTRASSRPVSVMWRSVSSSSRTGRNACQVNAPPPTSPTTTTIASSAVSSARTIAEKPLAFERRATDLKDRAVHEPFGSHFEPYRRAPGRHDAPPLAVAQLLEGVRAPTGGHAGQQDLGVGADQPDKHLVFAARRLLGGDRAADPVHARALESCRVIGELDADQVVVALVERSRQQEVGDHGDEQHAHREDRGIPERQPEAERLGYAPRGGAGHEAVAG